MLTEIFAVNINLKVSKSTYKRIVGKLWQRNSIENRRAETYNGSGNSYIDFVLAGVIGEAKISIIRT